jgi:hypothetical protein
VRGAALLTHASMPCRNPSRCVVPWHDSRFLPCAFRLNHELSAITDSAKLVGISEKDFRKWHGEDQVRGALRDGSLAARALQPVGPLWRAGCVPCKEGAAHRQRA